MSHYTIQVSDHPGAGSRLPTTEASESWVTTWDDEIQSPGVAMQMVDDLATEHHHVRAFRGRNLGKLWYAVLRMGGIMDLAAAAAIPERTLVKKRIP